MQHNANKPRLNIPYDPAKQESRETIEKKYKGVAARLLKLYTDDRAKVWASVYGIVTNKLKETWSSIKGFFSHSSTAKQTPESITDFHDKLIKEIIHLTTYESYTKLLEKLNTAAIEAYNSSQYRCLRVDLYFAIIQLLNEAIQLLFPKEYADDIKALHDKYFLHTKSNYNERFDTSRELLEICKEREDVLVQLVLRGDRSVYRKAFNPVRKMFGYLSPVDSKDIGTHIAFLTKQFLQEDRRKVSISHNDLINTNLPMPMQRFSTRLLVKLAFGVERMDEFVNNAMDDTELMKGNTSLYYKYLQSKSETAPKANQEPPDMNDLIKQDYTPEGSPVNNDDDAVDDAKTAQQTERSETPPPVRIGEEMTDQTLNDNNENTERRTLNASR